MRLHYPHSVKILNAKIIITFLLSAIFAVLMLLYKPYIIQIYGYSGYNYLPSVLRIIISISLFLISVIFTNLFLSDFTYAISILIKILFLIPSLVIFGLMSNNFLIPLSTFTLDILFVLGSKISIKIKSKSFSNRIQIILLLVLLIVLLIPFLYTYGTNVNLNLLLLRDIYKYRLAARSISTPLGQYPMFWMSKVVIPVILILSLSKKKYWLSLAMLVLLLLVFLVSGAHKSILFSLFIFLGFYLFNDYYKKIALFLSGVFFMIVIGFTFNDKVPVINDLLVRRTLLDPALLDTQYFEYFHNKPLYLGHSILRGLVDYPHSVQPSYLIGIEYYHNPMTNAGNGIISDGYLNFGMPGVFFEIFLAVAILVYLKSLNIEHRFFGVFFIIIYGLTATGILTNILTGGIFLIILIGQFILRNSALHD